MLFKIINIENSDKSRFSDLNKRVKNDHVLNKAKQPSTITVVHSLILNHQQNYNSNRQSQYQGVSNQLIFAQSGKTGDDEGETKYY